MPQNFLMCDREQELLLPPSLREWLPEGHLAWFVIEAFDALDLAAFYGDYRADGHGRRMIRRWLSRCCSTGTRLESARPGGLSAAALRTSRPG